MADITIVNGVYKPTYNWGAPSCRNRLIAVTSHPHIFFEAYLLGLNFRYRLRNPAPDRVPIGIPMKHCKSHGIIEGQTAHLPTGAGFLLHAQ